MSYNYEDIGYYLRNYKYIDKKIKKNDYINLDDKLKDTYALICIDKWLNSMNRVNKEIIELKFFKKRKVRNEIERIVNYEKSRIYNILKEEKEKLLLILNSGIKDFLDKNNDKIVISTQSTKQS